MCCVVLFLCIECLCLFFLSFGVSLFVGLVFIVSVWCVVFSWSCVMPVCLIPLTIRCVLLNFNTSDAKLIAMSSVPCRLAYLVWVVFLFFGYFCVFLSLCLSFVFCL